MSISNQNNIKSSEISQEFIGFITNQFIDHSETISEFFLSVEGKTISKSSWKEDDEIENILEKWNEGKIPTTISLKNSKYIKLHESPYNVVFRSIKDKNALIGIKFQKSTRWHYLFSIIEQTDSWQVFLTALKDIFLSISKISDKAKKFNILESNTMEIGVNYAETKKDIDLLIGSLEQLEFNSKFTDRGDSIKIELKYEKKQKKEYPDYVYKQYMK